MSVDGRPILGTEIMRRSPIRRTCFNHVPGWGFFTVCVNFRHVSASVLCTEEVSGRAYRTAGPMKVKDIGGTSQGEMNLNLIKINSEQV